MTPQNDISIRIGGEAGQGMKLISGLLGKIFVQKGFWVFTNQDVRSRIRGGHNFSQIRIANHPIHSHSSQVDLLVSLDEKTLDLHKEETEGPILYDEDSIKGNPPSGNRYIPVSFQKIAQNTGGDARMANSVASGALLALLGIPLDSLYKIQEKIFQEKGKKIIEANQKSAQAGFKQTKNAGKEKHFYHLKNPDQTNRMILTGSEAMGMGALASNLRFYSAYPMSPATTIMEFLASRKNQHGLIVEQAEDEISAINMAIGAFFSGARAMVATSGGGMALMVEGISLAGMTETPVVIINAQRPAPATGFPTRTEQADLLYAAHAGHGEFPRCLLAPSTAEEAFYLTNKAFYLAEKYHSPVIILGDQYLNDSSWTVEKLNLENLYPDPQGFLSEEKLKNMNPYEYRRYQMTPSGITPRIRPGTPHQVLYADSDEHTEEGHITESARVRNQMVEKRLSKEQGLLKEMSSPQIYPHQKADIYLLSWGSTWGIVDETVKTLRNKGTDIGYIHFSEIFPFRKDSIPPGIIKTSRLIGVENNATGAIL
ncbi:2-oxoacid:acceptor oxidoreductase subunit alpha [bacterium]|nr:2-oxoacid:acceptor oxidoreductase subunit alpha [bacterium]